MYEFELFGDLALPDLALSIFKCMTYAYGSGHTEVRIFIDSQYAFDCLAVLSRGWGRHDLFHASWVPRRGIQFIIVSFFLNLLI